MEIRQEGGVSILAPQGRLMGGPETDELERAVRGALLQGDRRIVLDLSAVDFMNSVATGMLISLRAHCQRERGALRLCRLNERLQFMFANLKIWPLVFEVYPTLEEARASFEAGPGPPAGGPAPEASSR